MSNVFGNWAQFDGRLFLNLKCKDFNSAIKLLNLIARAAEKLQHHPDICIKNYNELVVSTITHETNTITDKDYQLAGEINAILKSESLS